MERNLIKSPVSTIVEFVLINRLGISSAKANLVASIDR